MTDTSSAAFFDEKYRTNSDPWNFASDTYENARYRSILQALAGRHFRFAFEPGCSIGVLTHMLAGVADKVQACDFSPTAAEAARTRCADAHNVTVACRPLTAEEPWPCFDLVVLSEIGYYFTPDAWQALAAKMTVELPSGATVVACHWLGHSPDHVQHGDEVHEVLAAQAPLQHVHGERHGTEAPGSSNTHSYRIDLWRRL